MQLGVVNAAECRHRLPVGRRQRRPRRRHGFQFGVVNVAQHDDGESFALINLIGNGIHDVALYATDTMLTNLGFKLGGRHLYTSWAPATSRATGCPAGLADVHARHGALGHATSGSAGGSSADYGRLSYLELEATGTSVYPVWGMHANAPMVNALRLQAGVRLAPHIALLAGLAYNVAVGQESTDADLSLTGLDKVVHSGATTVRMYPGFVLGLQI